MKTASIKRTLALVALSALASLAWGLDLGGSIDNTSAGVHLFTPQVGLNQSDKASLWLSHNFDDNTSLFIKGNFKIGLGQAFTPDVALTMTGDLDQLNFNLLVPKAFGDQSRLSLVLGRSAFADFSGEILNHKLDGVNAELKFPEASLRIGLGTSALLFRHSSGLFSTPADLSDVAEWVTMYQGKAPSWDVAKALAAPKLFFVANLSVPKLFASVSTDANGKVTDVYPGLTLNAGVVGQLDLSPKQVVVSQSFNGTDRVPVDVAYAGLGLNGKLIGPLFVDAYAWLEAGYTLSAVNGIYHPNMVLSNMDSLRFTVYLTEVANSVLDFGGKIGLGDYNANGQFASTHNSTDMAVMFTPLSYRGVANVFNPQMTNLVQADLGYSIKPFSGSPGALKDFQVELRGLTFLRLLAKDSNRVAPISEKVRASSTENYLGSEIDLNLGWRPLSDLGLSINTGLFLPYDQVLDISARGLTQAWELKSTFTLSLSL